MTTTKHYPDSLTPAALALLDAQVSVEIALGEPTSGLLDGSARERRNRRILARALAGITPKYGVGVGQAAAELEDAERMAVPVEVATAMPVPVFGKSKGKGRKARRNAARRAARRTAATVERVA